MKPHARDYVLPAVFIVFLLNTLFVWIGNNVTENYVFVAQFFTVLFEVGITFYLAMSFESKSNKFKRDQRNRPDNNTTPN